MRAKVFRYTKIAGALLGVSLLTFLAVRIYDSQKRLPLEPWHTHVPHELSREKLDAANWTQYLAAEAKIFDDVQREVSRKLDRPVVCRPIGILRAVRFIPGTLCRISTGPLCSSQRASRSVPSCFCMD